MKVFSLNVLFLLVSNSAFAVDYTCRGAAGDPVVEIVEVNGRPQFQYLVEGKVQFSLTMGEGSIQPVTQLPIGFDAGKIFTFRKGERVHIYGRILPRGAIFDIFLLGIPDSVQRTLVDYECSIKVPR